MSQSDRPRPPPSRPTGLHRRLWVAGRVHTYPSEAGAVSVAGREDGPQGMALIRARPVRYQGRAHVVRPFYLDRAPITNEQYREFLVATAEPPPAHWVGWRVPVGYEQHPVVGVNLDAARRFARWRGARLPSEVEWAGAASGPTGTRRFPWGDRCDGLRCHCPLMGHNEAGPVKTHPSGASREGIQDLFGNVWEWTEPSPACPAPAEGRVRVLGGSFAHCCTAWTALPVTEVVERRGYAYVGFRCAADLAAAG